MLIEQTFEKLSDMKMRGFATALQEQLDGDDYDELAFEERIGLLIDREWTERETRRLTRRLQWAKLREQAAIEDIDFRHRRGLDRTLMKRLATCEWVKRSQNILITGPTGIGNLPRLRARAQGVSRRILVALPPRAATSSRAHARTSRRLTHAALRSLGAHPCAGAG